MFSKKLFSLVTDTRKLQLRNFHNRRYKGKKKPRGQHNAELNDQETPTYEEIMNERNFPNLKKGKAPNPNRPKATFEYLNKKPEKPFKKMTKKKITEEEFKKKIDEQITKERGGGSEQFDGEITQGTKEFYDEIERFAPQAFYDANEINKDTSGWLFRGSPAVLQQKPSSKFEKNLHDYRTGRLIDPKKWKESYKENMNQLPIFIKKPKDPFRANPHLVRRISFKDPSVLYKFLTPTGKITNNRFTGVRWKTQRRIAKEIKKARFLGIIPFVGNVEYKFGGKYQPSVHIKNIHDADEEERREEHYQQFTEGLVRHKDSLRNYMQNLEKEISYGSPDRIPKSVSNPTMTIKTIQKEIRGGLPKQMKKKQEEIEFVEEMEEKDIPKSIVQNLTNLSLKNKIF